MTVQRVSIPLMLCLAGLAVAVTPPAQAVERCVLGEEFTNTG